MSDRAGVVIGDHCGEWLRVDPEVKAATTRFRTSDITETQRSDGQCLVIEKIVKSRYVIPRHSLPKVTCTAIVKVIKNWINCDWAHYG